MPAVNESALPAFMAGGCISLSLLMLLSWAMTGERLRLRRLAGRMLSLPGQLAYTSHSEARRRVASMVKHYTGLQLPLGAACGLLGLSAVLGLAVSELVGLRGWYCFLGAAAGPAAIILWRLNIVTGRSGVLARQTHGVLHEMHIAAAGGETPARALAQAAARAKDPLRSLLSDALRAHAAGEELVVALGRVHELAGCWEYRMLLDALKLQADTECSLGQLLAETVERADEALLSGRELDAKLGEARWTARVLALVPVCLAGYLAAARPWALAPLTEDPVGRGCLLTGCLLWLGGIAATSRLQRPPDRLRHWT